MSKRKDRPSKSSNLSEEQRERKRMGNKASRIRKRLEAGKPVSDRDRAFLTTWDASLSGDAPPPDTAPRGDTPGIARDGDAASPSAATGDDDGGGASPPADAEPPPPPPSPPRILPSRARGSGGGGGGDWRDAYRVASDGREATCIQVAELWIAGLEKLNAYITESGRTPVITEEAIEGWLRPSIVLTVDQVLPEKFEVSPPVLVACGTTATVVQAAVARARGPVGQGDDADRAKAARVVGTVKSAEVAHDQGAAVPPEPPDRVKPDDTVPPPPKANGSAPASGPLYGRDGKMVL